MSICLHGNRRTYIPMLSGEPVSGYWVVTAATEDAAKAMIEERMIKRAYLSLRREWANQGRKVKEQHDQIRA